LKTIDKPPNRQVLWRSLDCGKLQVGLLDRAKAAGAPFRVKLDVASSVAENQSRQP
jgi:hypothetical protein